VIGAAEELSGVAAGLGRDARALVRAAVVQHVHLAVGVPHQQHRLRADRGAKVVAGIRNLTIMADIDPAIREHVLHFELEHLFADVDVAVNLLVADQRAKRRGVAGISGHAFLHHRSSTSRLVFAREMQICITLFDAFSLSLRM
jgi:hypothetical protein